MVNMRCVLKQGYLGYATLGAVVPPYHLSLRASIFKETNTVYLVCYWTKLFSALLFCYVCLLQLQNIDFAL